MLYLAEGFDDFPVSGANNAPARKVYSRRFAIPASYDNADGVSVGRYGYGRSKNIYTKDLVLTNVSFVNPNLFIAFAVRRSSDDGTGPAFLRVMNNDLSASHASLHFGGADGEDLVVRDATGAIAGTASSAFPLNTWVWVSIKLVSSDTSGEVVIKDASLSTVLSLTGLDTLAAPAGIGAISFPAGPIQYRLDDLFIADPSGPRWNDFIPDFEVRTYTPVLSYQSGSTYYGSPSGIMGTEPDDSTYVRDGSYIEKTLAFEFPAVSPMTGIRGLATQFRVAVYDDTERTHDHGVFVTDFNFTAPDMARPGQGPGPYITSQAVFEVNPETGTDWTDTALDTVRPIFKATRVGG